MLHTLEMPSFLADESYESPASTHSHSLHGSPYEPLGELRSSHEKNNGNISSNGSVKPTNRSANQSAKGSFDGYFDERGTGVNGSQLMNGSHGKDMENETLNTAANGRVSASSWENGRKGSMEVNGVNGASENGRKSPAVPNGYARSERNSISSTHGVPNGEVRAVVNGEKKITVPVLPPINPQSTGPLTYGNSLLPVSPIPESPVRNTNSPHRFSSPPSYPAPPPPHQSTSAAPALPPLKHRHTLQVPKVGPGRGSKDGFDEGFSSGRFSPTTASAARRGSLSLNRRNTRSIHSDMPHEEAPQDEDAMRWAEAIRQKRASKRRKKDEEDDDRVVVGTKVDQNHVNWVTAYNMLTGIRFTVSRTNAKLDRPLTDADFEARHKFSFDITGNELTPSAKYDFKFKDYAPWVFRTLRADFKLDPADYLMSLTSKYILSELGSPGKSGSFFYFSRDYKYIIKTIHHAEHKFLRKILKDYYNHVQDNPNTLLSQFYGLHRVKIPYGRKIHFVVMNNLFPPHRDIHHTYDLKGSTVGRDFKEEDLEKNPRATLKDLNWLRRNLHLEFGPEKKRLFIEQMERDVHLLQKLRIMDYSLLVGIHDLEKGNQENLRDKTLQIFQPGGEDEGSQTHPMLLRTPSKLENARKARELRQIIKQEKPIPMGQSSSRMPDQMEENAIKKDFTFYSDDGGFQATHDDNRAGDEIYYLGIIDCLTHYGMVKRLEHFWKGLSHDKNLISPVPSVPYGDRFIKFINGVTKTREEAEREDVNMAANHPAGGNSTSIDQQRGKGDLPGQNGLMHRSNTDNSVVQHNESQALKTEAHGASENNIPDRTLGTIRSPSTERGNDRMMLPIVDEVGESSSTGGRSGRSRSVNEEEREGRPATPPKDGKMKEKPNGSIRSVDKDLPQPPPSDEKRGNSFDSMKALPALPKVSSPEAMEEKDSVVL